MEISNKRTMANIKLTYNGKSHICTMVNLKYYMYNVKSQI